MDAHGNFALYGLRDYYLYKFVNGKEVKQPITKYGVRPNQLYISAEGKSIHVFKTDDSIYVYQDDSLLFPVQEKIQSLRVEDGFETLPLNQNSENVKTGKELFYIESDSVGYLVFNGTFSKPMLPVSDRTWGDDKMEGEIIAAEINENGFYAIQKRGNNSWLVNINNTYYINLDEVSKVYYKSVYFTRNALVFYGVKGNSIYQFKVVI
jgi:hypothetical protein